MNREELEEFIHKKREHPVDVKKSVKSDVSKYFKILRTVSDELVYLKQQGLPFNDIVEFLEAKRDIKVPKKVLIYFYKKEILNNKRDTLENLIKESESIKYRFDKLMDEYKGRRVNLNGLIYKISNCSIASGKLNLGLTTADKQHFEVIDIDPANGDMQEQIEKLLVKS